VTGKKERIHEPQKHSKTDQQQTFGQVYGTVGEENRNTTRGDGKLVVDAGPSKIEKVKFL